ncbi:MAG TPA: PH domain-containing protein [Aliicoccus persicus]|uniref:PH domain-containing protein n=1 Tax=Aliicoccus persicus TaxID=930138 RepID=A0A921DWZ9_9STAP|nr:PH domain-containing protein [Aliicoccus persicus]
MKQISKRAITLWRIKEAVTAVVVALLAVVAYVLSERFDWMPLFVTWILAGIALLLFLTEVIIIPNIKYRTTTYGIVDDVLKVHKGVFTKSRQHVPLIRIQNIDTKQGPLMARFNLKGVQLRTASSIVYIPELESDEADSLRDEIRQIVNENVGSSI